MDAIYGHSPRDGLDQIYWFMAGLSLCAFIDHYYTGEDDPDGGDDSFIRLVADRIYPHYVSMCGEWEDEDEPFATFLIWKCDDAQDVWPYYLDNVRANMGHLAFPRALKESDLFDDPGMRTIATLAAMVLIDHMAQLDEVV